MQRLAASRGRRALGCCEDPVDLPRKAGNKSLGRPTGAEQGEQAAAGAHCDYDMETSGEKSGDDEGAVPTPEGRWRGDGQAKKQTMPSNDKLGLGLGTPGQRAVGSGQGRTGGGKGEGRP